MQREATELLALPKGDPMKRQVDLKVSTFADLLHMYLLHFWAPQSMAMVVHTKACDLLYMAATHLAHWGWHTFGQNSGASGHIFVVFKQILTAKSTEKLVCVLHFLFHFDWWIL